MPEPTPTRAGGGPSRYPWRSTLFGIWLMAVAYVSTTWPYHRTDWALLATMVASALLALVALHGLHWLARTYRVSIMRREEQP